jgi:hypothetical protein
MPAQIIELADYRAARTSQTATPMSENAIAPPTATRPANSHAGTDSATAALALMAAACRAWVDSLRQIRVAALAIAAQSIQLQEAARVLRAQSRSVTEIGTAPSTLAVPIQRAAD